PMDTISLSPFITRKEEPAPSESPSVKLFREIVQSSEGEEVATPSTFLQFMRDHLESLWDGIGPFLKKVGNLFLYVWVNRWGSLAVFAAAVAGIYFAKQNGSPSASLPKVTPATSPLALNLQRQNLNHDVGQDSQWLAAAGYSQAEIVTYRNTKLLNDGT